MPTVYYRALLEPAADGGYGVFLPEVPGCTSGGDTVDEAARNAAEALSAHLGLLLEDGDPLPEPAPLDAPVPDWLDEPGGEPLPNLVRLLVPATCRPRRYGWTSPSTKSWQPGSTPQRERGARAGRRCSPRGRGARWHANKAGGYTRSYRAARELTPAMTTLTAYVERDAETGLYVGIVPGVPGAHSQGATLDELAANLREVAELLLEDDASLRERLPHFVGLQQIEVA